MRMEAGMYGDVKASKVFLEVAMGAQLYDFGSALTGFMAAFRPPRHVPALPATLIVPALHLLQLARWSGRVQPHHVASRLELLTGMQRFCDRRLLTSAVDRRADD
ncbi:uncharacterized protein [Aegilops tauschii subsp. strangulata]|uniref:uncharacterized protein n=1 Tax=Aegilops tauschii subsp. strangulata TaxID=200361 RepID=UPI003CC85C9F